jgi:hypothetical protein
MPAPEPPTLTRATVAGGMVAALLVLLALAYIPSTLADLGARAATPSAPPPPTTATNERSHGVLYGRVVTSEGASYEGRLRFGGDEEAFWGHSFNGVKRENPWATHVPGAATQRPLEIFGFAISAPWHPQPNVRRPMMARFGDIARIEASGRDLRVTLKSGTVFPLDRFAADDVADGLRIWDRQHGIVDLDEWRIRSIEFLPGGRLDAASDRLHGTVRTAHGDFTGFIQWDQQQCVGADELVGHTGDGEIRLRFDTIRAVARRSRDSALATLRDGREIVVSDTRQAGQGQRGIYVDDGRYGGVLVSWDAFERVDFSADPSEAGGGPAYTDFPAGHPLTGRVTTRSGQQLTGRLVYDLDESETTETLDAPFQGVDYNIPFGLVATIVPVAEDAHGAQRAQVTLHGGEQLALDRTGDLGDGIGGLLVFVEGRGAPAHVPWADVARIDLERPPAMYPPLRPSRF